MLVNCRRMRHIVSINSDGNLEPIAEPEAELSSTTLCASGLDQAHVPEEQLSWHNPPEILQTSRQTAARDDGSAPGC